MNTQKVPKAVEVPEEQYTDMNVDVPAVMQRQITSTHRWCRKQTTQNRFQSHERAEGDTVEQQRQGSTIRMERESVL